MRKLRATLPLIICACMLDVTPGFDCSLAAAAVIQTQVQTVPVNAGMNAVGAPFRNIGGFAATSPAIGLQGASFLGTINPNTPAPKIDSHALAAPIRAQTSVIADPLVVSQSPVVTQGIAMGAEQSRLSETLAAAPAAMAERASTPLARHPAIIGQMKEIRASLKDTRVQIQALGQLFENDNRSREHGSNVAARHDESALATDSPSHLAKAATPLATPEKSVLSIPKQVSAQGAQGKAKKWLAPVREIATWISRRLGIVRWVPFTPTGPGHFYHGTSWDNLIQIALSGGYLQPMSSCFALTPRESKFYARLKARGQNSKAILLEFQDQPTRPLVVDMLKYFGIPQSRLNRLVGTPYYFAIEPIPLAFLTEASKRSILAELQLLADTSDRQAYAKLSQALTHAFGGTKSLSQ